MIDTNKLDFWMANDLNVLMEGRRGVGKSTMIIEAAERNNLKWMYFSAATMDPFTDFVGTPYKAFDENGKPYIDFVRPRLIENDEVEFMFFDEFNRAKPKIRNAVMELIQFKSINGKPLKKLRMVWAAINPEHDDETDEDYNVEKLDPAEKDRFQVQVVIPTKADKKYFVAKYGEQGATIVQWWNSLDTKIQNMISPRRLDYAMEMYRIVGDLNDVLPRESNIGQLVTQLANGSFQDRLVALMAANDTDENVAAFTNENFFKGTLPIILNKKEWLTYFLDFFPDEKFNSLVTTNPAFRGQVLSNPAKVKLHVKKLQDIVDAQGAKKDIIIELRNAIAKLPIGDQPGIDPISAKFDEIGNDKVYGQSTQRIEITGLIKNVSFETLDMESLYKALAINAYVGGRTNGNFWSDTVKIFYRIDTGAKKLGGSLETLYARLQADTTLQAHFSFNGMNGRIEQRLKKLNYAI